MKPCLRSAHLFLAMACVCQALAFSPVAHSQTAAAAQAAQDARLVGPNSFLEGFIWYVGEEDDRIRGGTQAEKARVAGRTDYATAIGIDEGEEQDMLAILLEAHHQEEALEHKERSDETCRFLSSARWRELLQQ